MYKSVCFTGPRPKDLFGYEDARPYRAIIRVLDELIPAIVAKGTTRFVSGGAQGFDQLAFWAVNHYVQRLGIENVVYVPFKGQESRWSPYGLFGQGDYHKMIEKATEVKMLYDTPPTTGLVFQYLYDRNHQMVNDTDFVIALLAGRSLEWQMAKGGTSECVRYAMGKGKRVLVLRLIEGTVQEPVWL